MNQKTHAYHRLTDDVPEDVKSSRHMELAQVYRKEAELLNKAEVGREHLVLIEGVSTSFTSHSFSCKGIDLIKL